MKSLYLCKTNFFNFEEIKYPIDEQTKLFSTRDDIPPIQFKLKKSNEYEIKGNILVKKKKDIYIVPELDPLDLSEIELKLTDSYYEKDAIIIRNKSPFRNTDDLSIVEGNSYSIKQLFKITQRNNFKNSYNSKIYLNRVLFDFPKNLSDEINEEIKGMWLKLIDGANVNTVGAFGSNVEKHPIIEDIKGRFNNKSNQSVYEV